MYIIVSSQFHECLCGVSGAVVGLNLLLGEVVQYPDWPLGADWQSWVLLFPRFQTLGEDLGVWENRRISVWVYGKMCV